MMDRRRIRMMSMMMMRGVAAVLVNGVLQRNSQRTAKEERAVEIRQRGQQCLSKASGAMS